MDPSQIENTPSSQRQGRDAPHLHDEAFVVAAAALGDQLIFEASPFLVQLHHWVLTARRQNRTLSSHLNTQLFYSFFYTEP